MIVMRIEHTVPDFDAFHSQFAAMDDFRAAGGMRAYRLLRPVDDEHFVCIEGDFDDLIAAQQFVGRLETDVWPNSVPAGLHTEPTVTLLQVEGAPVTA